MVGRETIGYIFVAVGVTDLEFHRRMYHVYQRHLTSKSLSGMHVKGKGKAVPLQAWPCLEGG
jgi:hypothetical protein